MHVSEEVKARFIELQNMKLLPESTVKYLYSMREEYGVYPGVIYDIGACVLHWTNEAHVVWPEANFYCFEAMPETSFLYTKQYIKGFHCGVLSDVDDKEVIFHQNLLHPGGNSYYKENAAINPAAEQLYNDVQKRRTYTLDSIVKSVEFKLPDLIKMDVQGAELDILKGADMCLEHAKHLILELQVVEYNKGAPLRNHVIEYLKTKNFFMVEGSPFTNAGPDGDYHFVKE
jgi:FkbM family methyltransferase